VSTKSFNGKGNGKTDKGSGHCSTCGSLVSLSHNNCSHCGTSTKSSTPLSSAHGHSAHAPPVDTNGTDAGASFVDPFKDIDGKACNLGKGARAVDPNPASNGNGSLPLLAKALMQMLPLMTPSRIHSGFSSMAKLTISVKAHVLLALVMRFPQTLLPMAMCNLPLVALAMAGLLFSQKKLPLPLLLLHLLLIQMAPEKLPVVRLVCLVQVMPHSLLLSSKMNPTKSVNLCPRPPHWTPYINESLPWTT